MNSKFNRKNYFLNQEYQLNTSKNQIKNEKIIEYYELNSKLDVPEHPDDFVMIGGVVNPR